MPALIDELLGLVDNSGRVRDQIAAILKVEAANQQVLAAGAGEDPALWKLRVFTECSNPWEQFQSPPTASDTDAEIAFDKSPVVNVSFDSSAFDKASGNVVERQKADGTFYVDCFACGISADKPNEEGHVPGDQLAALEAHRAATLVRRILMAGAYTYLAWPRGKEVGAGVVWGRWVSGVQMSNVPASERVAQHIAGARVTLQVQFNEFSPQVKGELLELVSTTVTRAGTGEILIAADYPIPFVGV